MEQRGVFPESMRSERRAGDNAREAGPPNWYVLHVRSRHEFVTYHELRQKSVDAFLPSLKRLSQWKDRRKLIEHALFPGYVFVQTSPHPEAFLNILKTRGVVSFISQEQGIPTPVPPEEMNSLRIMVESGQEMDVYPGLKEGTKVRIKTGPLASAEGILSRKKNEYSLLVNIELLGRSVAVQISAQDLESA